MFNTRVKEKGTKHKRKAAKINDIFKKKIARLIPLNFALNFDLNIALNIVLNFASITNPHILP